MASVTDTGEHPTQRATPPATQVESCRVTLALDIHAAGDDQARSIAARLTVVRADDGQHIDPDVVAVENEQWTRFERGLRTRNGGGSTDSRRLLGQPTVWRL